MNDDEKKILKEIANLYLELKKEAKPQTNVGIDINGKPYVTTKKPSDSTYIWTAKKLRDAVAKLINEHKPSYIDKTDYEHLNHTINKEVSYVEDTPEKTISGMMNKATYQIRLDIYSLLQEAKKELGIELLEN